MWDSEILNTNIVFVALLENKQTVQSLVRSDNLTDVLINAYNEFGYKKLAQYGALAFYPGRKINREDILPGETYLVEGKTSAVNLLGRITRELVYCLFTDKLYDFIEIEPNKVVIDVMDINIVTHVDQLYKKKHRVRLEEAEKEIQSAMLATLKEDMKIYIDEDYILEPDIIDDII